MTVPNMTTTFYLMASDMHIQDPTDEAIVKEWFPLHFIHGSNSEYASAFSVSATQSEVLETILKVQLLGGMVLLLAEDDFGRLLLDCLNHLDEYDLRVQNVDRQMGSFISIDSWRQRMRRGTEEEAAGEDLHDESDECSTAQEDMMSLDSNSVRVETDDEDEYAESAISMHLDGHKPLHSSEMMQIFSNRSLEECGLPTCSSAGCLI